MKTKLILMLLSGSGLLAQVVNTPLQVTRYLNVRYTSVLDCGGGTQLDNRSQQTRQNDNWSFLATGTGTWSVAMNFSDTACTGPWTSFGSGATVTNSSANGIGFGLGYHHFVQFVFSGANASTVSVNISGWKNFYATSGGSGSTIFPIQISQGGTSANNTISAKVNLNVPFWVSSDFNFSSQNPGVTLIAHGVNQAVPMNPCPIGVNGSDSRHYLYINDGGNSEAVLITGGTCTSGSGSGNVTVTPVNGHSGSGWSIASATSGVQETIQYMPQSFGGTIWIPPGMWNIYAPIDFDLESASIVGASMGSSILSCLMTSGICLNMDGPNSPRGTGGANTIQSLSLNGPGFGPNAMGIYINKQNGLRVQDVNIIYMGTGIEIDDGSTYSIHLDRVSVGAMQTNGVGILVANGADIFFNEVVVVGNFFTNLPRACIEVLNVGGLYMRSISILGATNNLLIDPSAGDAKYIFCDECISDLSVGDSTKISPSGTGRVQLATWVNSWFATAGANGYFHPNPHYLGNGFSCTTTGGSAVATGITITSSRVTNNTKNGIYIGTNCETIKISDTTIMQNSIDVDSTETETIPTYTYMGIYIDNNVNRVSIHDVTSGGFGIWIDSQKYGVYVAGTTNDDIFISDLQPARSNQLGLLYDNSNGQDKTILFHGPISVASADTIDPTTSDPDILVITGTTGINTISRGWDGRTLVLIKIDSGSVVLGAGSGNIFTNITLNAKGRVSCTYNTGFVGWFCN